MWNLTPWPEIEPPLPPNSSYPPTPTLELRVLVAEPPGKSPDSPNLIGLYYDGVWTLKYIHRFVHIFALGGELNFSPLVDHLSSGKLVVRADFKICPQIHSYFCFRRWSLIFSPCGSLVLREISGHLVSRHINNQWRGTCDKEPRLPVNSHEWVILKVNLPTLIKTSSDCRVCGYPDWNHARDTEPKRPS